MDMTGYEDASASILLMQRRGELLLIRKRRPHGDVNRAVSPNPQATWLVNDATDLASRETVHSCLRKEMPDEPARHPCRHNEAAIVRHV
jgi:hypothetical protein